MAERRMFAKTIIDSDAFLDMPVTARLLYYDLAMRADDDGFVNSPKKIMRTIGASQDDLGILIMRKFILPFENGVVVIKHWRIHNYIRRDRYNETTYGEEKALLEFDENNAYRFKKGDTVDQLATNGQPNDNQRLTQVRLGKVSIEKDIYTPTDTDLKTEFETVWKEYPRKEGKINAERDYIKARKEGVEQQTILDGIRRYKAKLKAENTEMQFTMQGSTWFHQRRWTDEYEAGKKRNYAERSYTDYEEVYQ